MPSPIQDIYRRLRSAGSAFRAALAARPRLVAALAGAAVLPVWVASASTAWFVYDIAGAADTADLRTIGDMPRATTVFDRHGEPVFTFFREQRIEVPLERVSPHLIRAVLAIEDQRFYEHRGVDLVRVVGAAVANAREGRAVQGGSTITQQLARQSFLTREKTVTRKLREIVLAARIELEYSKAQILEHYLNRVYFGDGLYGVEAAARGYFGKPAAGLDPAEAALLAGLIKSPSAYAPTMNPERAVARRNVVLQAMRHTGAIDAATFGRASAATLTLRNSLHAGESFGLYFKEHVRRELVARFGAERVYEGGLRVRTTLDPALQRAADRLVEESLARIEGQPRFPHPPRQAGDSRPADASGPSDYLQGALVAMDPATGQVLALVGGRDFQDSHFNRAVQAHRQAGSAFKPFVYAAALEGGFTPATLVEDLDDPVLTPEGEWVPEDEHTDATEMTVRTALRTSSNRAAVRVLQSIGIRQAVDYAHRLSLGTLPAVPSLALGSGSVTLLDMVTAYSAFADGGLVHEPFVIRRVEDDGGEVLFEAAPESTRALSEATAFLMAQMLADVVNAGTGARARHEGFRLPAAGKTGTTNDYKDAWFIGFTPSLVAGVWVGFDQPKTIAPDGYGGELAVPLWAAFMKAATRGAKPRWIERPAGVVGVEVCRLSGLRPADGCRAVDFVSPEGEVETRSAVYTEYFVRGTEPQHTCDLHPGRSLFRRVVGIFGGGDGAEAPVPQVTPRPPEPRPEVAEPEQPVAAADEEAAEPPKQKKRGFWARLFGFGRGDREDREQEEEEQNERPGPPQR